MPIKVEFEPRDLWVGVYWNRKKVMASWDYKDTSHYTSGREYYWMYDIYICFVPILPIHISWRRIINNA